MKLARPILLLTLPLLFGGLACAQGKGADRQLRKAEKAVLKRAGQHFAARHPDRLLKKGSRLRVNARSVRPQAAAAAFIGMAHPAYREAYKGKEEAWFKRLLQRKGRWHGQPLIVERWKALAVVAHRDAVTVDALVTFAGRKAGEARLIRQVWVKKERGLYLAMRPTEEGSPFGPVPADSLLEGFASSVLSANAFLLQALEEAGKLAKEKEPGKKLAEKLKKLEVADFGELIEAGSDEEGNPVAVVRCGYLRARVILKKALEAEPGARVLFDGVAQALDHPKNPWRGVKEEREGKELEWRCVTATFKGGVTVR
ncbi:MAG TPA: hypothetical protein DEA08_36205 [Planctomycetes bacterium]|nr:hypothetical protein [Planctomycetota bacterium]